MRFTMCFVWAVYLVFLNVAHSNFICMVKIRDQVTVCTEYITIYWYTASC